MKQIIKTPTKILIDGKYELIAKEIEIYWESPKKNMTPQDWVGQVMDIKRSRDTNDNKKGSKEEFRKHWDKFKNNKESHTPI